MKANDIILHRDKFQWEFWSAEDFFRKNGDDGQMLGKISTEDYPTLANAINWGLENLIIQERMTFYVL